MQLQIYLLVSHQGLLTAQARFNTLFLQQHRETLAGSRGCFQEERRPLPHHHTALACELSLEAHTTAAGKSKVQYLTSPVCMSTRHKRLHLNWSHTIRQQTVALASLKLQPVLRKSVINSKEKFQH